MAAETSEGTITLELHGFLSDRLAALGHKRGSRTLIAVPVDVAPAATVGAVLGALAAADPRYALLFELDSQALPEHVEVVLNERVLDLQGGLAALLKPGDVLRFLPAHAGGS